MNPTRINILIGAINLIAFSSLVYFHFAAQPKIAYVNSTELLNGYHGMTNARSAFQQKSATWKSNIDTLSKEVQTEIEKFNALSKGMSKKEKELSQQLITAKQEKLQQYRQAIEAQAMEEEQRSTTAVLAEVNSFLMKYGEENGYKIILAVTEYGNVAYADKNLDLTKEVLAALNGDSSKK